MAVIPARRRAPAIESGTGRRLRAPLAWGAAAVGVIWALVPIALLAYHTIRHGGVLSGSNGALAGADQLYYMDSVRQSGTHVLIADHFATRIGPAVFVDPVFLLGGLLWRAGLPLQGAFWVLNVLGAAALALGAALVASIALKGRRARAGAVVLGLFYMMPLVPLLAWSGADSPLTRYELLVPAGETMPAWQLWGYPGSAVAMAAMAAAVAGAVAIVTGERAGRPRSARMVAAVAAAACLTAWLHPWQGVTLMLILAALITQGRSRRVTVRLGAALLGACLPLAYEEILSRVDLAWRMDARQNSVGHDPLWMIALVIAPLLLASLPGLRRFPRGPLRLALVAWPAAGLLVYFVSSQFAYHALQGISIPLAVLALAGCRGALPARSAPARRARAGIARRARRLAAAGAIVALAAFTIPGAAYELTSFRNSERSGAAPYWLTADEHAALVYLQRDRAPGAVLATQYLGMAVPAFTGRRTWVGEWTWTPDFDRRAALAEQLFSGRLGESAARALVRGSGARFLLAGCSSPQTAESVLRPLLSSVRSFGCVRVYALRAGA